MSLAPSYPGIYIEELPSSIHTITPTPTSIAVFIGYTHPYKTRAFNQAIQIFSFADYQRQFGGVYRSAWLDANVAYAVQQFFLNGGSQAYVFGLQSQNFAGWAPPSAGTSTSFAGAPAGGPSTTNAANTITFSALEPIDAVHPMSITLTNISQSVPSTPSTPGSGYDTADIAIRYGSSADFSTQEQFRKVSLNSASPNYIENVINGVSNLIWISPGSATPPISGTTKNYGAYWAPQGSPPSSSPPSQITLTLPGSISSSSSGLVPPFQSPDFTDPTKGPFVTNGSLDKVPVLNLILLPGITDAGVWAQAIAFAERKRAFLIMDPPPNFSADGMTPPPPAPLLPSIQQVAPGDGPVPTSTNAALYFPYLNSLDPLSGNPIRLPPSGFVAGIFAATDANRGVWKAPAGLATTINNVTGVVPEGVLTDSQAGVLNPIGINAIRTFAGSGTVVFGARTTTTADSALEQWRYVPVRRMALFIEQTLYANLGWAVFEPNDTPLWTALATTVSAFMLTLFNQGAFQGSTPSQAFQVVCDSTTTTQTDIDNGIVNIRVAFAPLIPAEFVVIQIAQLAGQAQSS